MQSDFHQGMLYFKRGIGREGQQMEAPMAKQFALGILLGLILSGPWQLLAKERTYSDSCLDTLSKNLLKLLTDSIDHTPAGASISPELKLSLASFCTCKERLSKEGPVDWLELSFKDPREFFDQDDQCALDTLSQADYHLLFLSQLKSRMVPLVQGRLHERYRGLASHVATQASYNTRLRCVTDKMLIQCSRSLSLATTYLCVNNFLSSAGKIDYLEASCPRFRTEDSPENADKNPFMGPRI